MVVASRASLIVTDVLVLIITWRSTHKNFRTQGFAGVLLRDGKLQRISGGVTVADATGVQVFCTSCMGNEWLSLPSISDPYSLSAQLLLNIFYFIALFNIVCRATYSESWQRACADLLSHSENPQGDAFNALGVNTLAGTFTVP